MQKIDSDAELTRVRLSDARLPLRQLLGRFSPRPFGFRKPARSRLLRVRK
jgi:hypothetical protein